MKSIVAAGLCLGAAIGMAAIATEAPRPVLPPPVAGKMALEDAIRQRRSVRRFEAKALTRQQVAQLCWAAQGITEKGRGLRSAPSAGALYPIELYVVTPDGVGHYQPREHALEHCVEGDRRPAVREAAGEQESIGQAGACFVIAADIGRTARKYGPRAERYCLLEAGHVAQNLLLQATALGLGGVPIGAFDDDRVAEAIRLPSGQRVLYLVPIGHPRA